MNNINLPFIEEYIRDTLPASKGLLRDIEIYANENHIPIVHKEVGVLLQVITKAAKVEKVLEVGTAVAYSTLLFSEAMGECGHITTIDRNKKMIPLAKENIEKAGKTKNVRLIEGDATTVLKQLKDRYDLIF